MYRPYLKPNIHYNIFRNVEPDESNTEWISRQNKAQINKMTVIGHVKLIVH